MPVHDTIDGAPSRSKPTPPRRFLVGPRVLLYLHLMAVFLTILICQSGVWGYADLWNDWIPETLGEILSLCCGVSVFLPTLILIRQNQEEHDAPTRGWSRFLVPLSVAMSFLQFLALIPLVQ